MSLLKRALLSVTRRKAKTTILLIIVIILSNIMLSTLLIVQSIDKTQKNILEGLPPMVTLQLDYEKIEHLYRMYDYDYTQVVIPWLTFNELELVMEACSAYILFYDYSTAIDIETRSLKSFYADNDDYYDTEANYFYLNGIENPELTILEVGTATIVDGRTFTDQEVQEGSPVIIIGKQLAQVNNLMAGETIEIEIIHYDFTEKGEKITIGKQMLIFEVIGIIDYLVLPTSAGSADYDIGAYMLEEKNRNLYTSNSYVAKHIEDIYTLYYDYYRDTMSEDDLKWPEYNPLAGVPVIFFLNSIDEVDIFIEEAYAVLHNDFYHFITQEDNLKIVAQPLETMKQVLTYALFITIGSAILVLSLVLIGFIKDRQHEIGIYLALGEQRFKIVGQLFIESFFVGILGATLAMLSGLFLASYISETMLTLAIIDGSDVFMTDDIVSGFSPINYDSILDNYAINLTMDSVLLYFTAIILTIAISLLISSIAIFRLDPKKVLM